MRVLFVNACCRGEASRTLRLANAVMAEWLRQWPDTEVITHDLYDMQLHPMTAGDLSVRDRCCDAHDWQHELTAPAYQFQQSDAVIVAAPYWDLSFPAILKTWVENMWIRNLTFVYRSDQPVGLCQGKACIYVTTSGSPIGEADFGTEYIRGVMQTLGIPDFLRLSAEGLDIDGNDPEQILLDAEARIGNVVKTAQRLF